MDPSSPVKEVLRQVVKIVLDDIRKIAKFKSTLHLHKSTLLRVQPLFYEIDKLNRALDRPVQETERFTHLLRDGKDLADKCSTIEPWNIGGKLVQSKRLRKWHDSLVKYLEIEVPLMRAADVKKQLLENRGRVSEFSGSCRVPELPDLVVGLDEPLRELKSMLLLNNKVPAVVVSAPGGYGKTTLAQLLCHDDDIKDIFEDNIFFVTVSRTANLYAIVRRIFLHKNHQPPEFLSDKDAINQLENFLKEIGSDPILLVLDDVWSEWQPHIHDFMFRQILGFKVLVTSRDVFPEFDVTYNLRMLDDQNALTLFRHSTFPEDKSSNMPDSLVNEIAKGCKGTPLALRVVGRSLCRRPEAMWRTVLDRWSKGKSIFDSNNNLLRCLQTSIDSLDKKTILKELYLDLALFPEDQKIPATLLMDMWVELYGLDEEGMYTINNLLELSFKSLVNLVHTRKDDIEVDCYCNEHYVTQHDVLRELAIYLSNKEPIEHRKRLILDLPNSNFDESQLPIHARLLSISTGEMVSSISCNIELTEVEVVILNLQAENYTLPQFMEKMHRLKVLIVTNNGYCPAKLGNPSLLDSLSSLKRVRLEHLSISSFGSSSLPMMNLRKISLFMCEIGDTFDKCTTEIPLMFPNLVEIEIEYCHDLEHFPAGLCNLLTLKTLSITNCNKLHSFPEELGRLVNLELLRLHCCLKLEELPESIGSLHKLRIIDISDCVSLSKMPDRTRELSGLKKLHMRGCWGISELPPSVEHLTGLEHVICDEEIYYLWKSYEELAHVNIKVVKADINLNWLHNVGH